MTEGLYTYAMHRWPSMQGKYNNEDKMLVSNKEERDSGSKNHK